MRFWQLGVRGFKETYRDPLALGFLLAFPFIFMLLFGAAFSSSESPTYNIGIIDQDGTAVSQAFTNEALSSVSTLEIVSFEESDAALEELRLGEIRAYIIIPEGFGGQIALNQTGQAAQILLNITYDESDLVVADNIISTINTVTLAFAGIEIPLTINADPINIETEITNIDFIAPGVIIFGLLILIPTSARLMLRDKETRFLHRLLTTPSRPWDFIIGYSTSMLVVAVIQVAAFILLGWLFGMDIVGSIALASLIFMLTAVCSIGIGMVVASISKSESQGESLSWLFAMPLAIISGVWFSIEFMPAYIQNIANAFPFAHAASAAREVITKGVGMEAVSSDVIFLSVWTAGIFLIGIILFSRTMRS